MMVSDKFIEDVRRQHVADRRVERATNRQKIRRAPRGFKLGPFGELQKKATVTSRGSPRSQSIKAQSGCPNPHFQHYRQGLTWSQKHVSFDYLLMVWGFFWVAFTCIPMVSG
jgi:hypothetical protein